MTSRKGTAYDEVMNSLYERAKPCDRASPDSDPLPHRHLDIYEKVTEAPAGGMRQDSSAWEEDLSC